MATGLCAFLKGDIIFKNVVGFSSVSVVHISKATNLECPSLLRPRQRKAFFAIEIHCRANSSECAIELAV